MNIKEEEMAVKQKEEIMRYTFNEAVKSALKYFKGDDLAATVWVNKYALKDSQGHIYELSPEDMHKRITKEIVRIENKYVNPMGEELVYDLLKDFKYIIPQGSPMAGIGNNFQIGSLSNCFVIGQEKPADSYGGIIRIDEEQVQLMKRRGGVGHDLSHIRPSGSPVMNSALTSTGIVPFMERYSNSTREVAQDGRRGALMLSISVKHPDAENFIDAKMQQGKVTGANVSVKIDDDFMKAVVNGTIYKQQYPVEATNPKVVKEINARKLWEKIIHNAWKSAEPGILFWDTIIRESVADCYAESGFKTVSTNPCGEIPLCPYDSCRLIAINLYSYVDKPFTPKAKFDFDLFKTHVQYAQRMMDDLIDLELEKVEKILEKINTDPEDPEIKRVERKLWEKIKDKAREGRRTGLGTTGEGDMLAALDLTYGTENAIDFSVEVHKTLALEAYRSSCTMAKERGSFDIWDSQKEKNNPFLLRIKSADAELYKDLMKYGRRNISLLTIAPTGTTSMMTQTTSGIEPVFSPVYKRRKKVNPTDTNVNIAYVDELGDSWEEYNVFHHKFLTLLEINGHDATKVKTYDDKLIEELVRLSPYHNATANDVDWLMKVRMQGAIQKWVDHSISVTVNLPTEATEDLVAKVYMTAWECGCKGVTVYRDGSRSGVLVTKKEEADKEKAFINAKKRPKTLDADVIKFSNKNGKWVAFVGLLDGKPYEIFTGMEDEEVLYIPKTIERGFIIKNIDEGGNKRYDFQYVDKHGYKTTFEGLSRLFDKEYWNYAKLISSVLRYGMPIPDVVNLVGSLQLDSENINTWKKGVERALKKYIPNGTKVKQGRVCERCGQEALVIEEGCEKCTQCGHSKCG